MSSPALAQAPRPLSFNDAVKIALAHNGDLYVSQADTLIAAAEVSLASSVFEPRLIANVRSSHEDQPGGALRFGWADRLSSGGLELAGRLPTGLTYSLGVAATVDRYTSPFQTIYNPAYTAALTLSVTQPLLRGGWRAANLQPIVVAALRHDLSELQLRAHVEQLVGEVELAYWSLAAAHQEREARATSVKLAEDQLAESTRLVQLGTISELDVVEARAGLSRAAQQLLRADQQVQDAEAALRGVIVGEPGPSATDALIPADAPELAAVSSSLAEHVELARQHRADLLAARAQTGVERAALAITEHELLPALDLIASGGVLGFAGELERNYATSGVSVFDDSLDPPYTADRALDGGMGQAFRNLVTGHGYTVSLGLRLELPIGNRAAQARHDRQRHVLARARGSERALLARIDNEIRRSLALVRSDEALARAADSAVELHERLLAGMRKRFSAGDVTSFDVLRVADELTRARIDAVRARVSYRISLARLALANGTLLDQHNITTSLQRRHNE